MDSGGPTLIGTRAITVKIKSDGDVFYELWKSKQHEISSLTPTTIQKIQPLEGEVGTVGCAFFWNYSWDGNDIVAKSQIIDIDEEKKSVTYEILEGDLMDLYKTFVTNIRVEKDGLETLVIWTVEYEKLGPDVPDPDTIMDFCIKTTQNIESGSLQN